MSPTKDEVREAAKTRQARVVYTVINTTLLQERDHTYANARKEAAKRNRWYQTDAYQVAKVTINSITPITPRRTAKSTQRAAKHAQYSAKERKAK